MLIGFMVAHLVGIPIPETGLELQAGKAIVLVSETGLPLQTVASETGLALQTEKPRLLLSETTGEGILLLSDTGLALQTGEGRLLLIGSRAKTVPLGDERKRAMSGFWDVRDVASPVHFGRGRGLP